MSRWQIARWATIMIVAPSWLMAQHGPLLPRPRDIRYGAGKLSLRGLSICLARSPAPEDSFAAQDLSKALSARAETLVPILQQNPCKNGILLRRTGGVDPLPVPGEHSGADSREAYALKVTPAGAEVSARSSAGIFYAVQTLEQLVEGEGARAILPEVAITDWPAMVYRGTMVDMSHGPLPTEDEVKRQLDFLSRWKANQYYFYSEASIELKGYPLINPEGRFSQQAIRRIVAYGRNRHIDVIPCLELYGHMHDLFRIERYSDLSDVPHGTEFDPHNLKVEALLNDWVDQFAGLFPSPFVHIGFDETFQIEAAAKQSCAAAEPAQLFVQQLTNVAERFQKHGKNVLAWGDIMIKYPDILSRLPPDLTAVAWEYHPIEDRYRQWLEPLQAHHIPEMIATGVTAWNQIAPDFDLSFQNIDTFVAAGRRAGTLGLINTVWTDDGQMLMRAAWPGMAYGAVAAWQDAPVEREAFFGDYSSLMYRPAIAPEVAAGLGNLARAEALLGKVLGDDTMIVLWEDPFTPRMLELETGHREDLRQARLQAEEAEEHIGHAVALGGDPRTLNSLMLGSRLLDYGVQKFQTPTELNDLWRRLGPRRPKGDEWWNEWESQVVYQDHSRIVDLMDAITQLRPLYRAEWLAEYTPYRLESALGRWNSEYEYWRKLQQRLHQFSDSSREGDVLPPLESLAGER